MAGDYRHTQFGGTTLVVLGVSVALAIAVNETSARGAATLGLQLVLLACIALFYCLRVEVDDRFVTVRFGVGVIRRHFPLADIVSVRTVRNRWYHGWGIRRIRRGWMFNVSGLDAVEITTSGGKNYRIGTDEPGALKREIERRIRRFE